MRTLIIGTTVACGLFSSPAFTQQPSQGQAPAQYGTIETKPPAGHGPTASEWSALANLPDWTGVWTPDIGDQERQEKENNVPWTVEAAAKIQEQIALENAGKPHGTHNTCLPWGMPGFMMLTHNAMEFLFTPGRITIIGELDGNNFRSPDIA